jgi:hypothetical protein
MSEPRIDYSARPVSVTLEMRQPNFDCRTLLSHAQLIVFQNNDQFPNDFSDWLEQNFRFWTRFVQEADKIRARGRTHYSSRTIVEVLRHESAVSDSDPDYKINDHSTPSLARLYMLVTPGAEGFFETRVLAKQRGGMTP